MWQLRLVKGDSMLRAYRNGQTVIISHNRHFKVNDVVIIFVDGKELLKRITDLHEGQVFVEGDNAEHSTDSRHFGWVNDRHITGKVIWPKKSKKLPE